MGILILLAQCIAMFLASFLAGSLPLMFRSAMSGLYFPVPLHIPSNYLS